MKRVAFRADASLKIGTGHVMRGLTLAHALRNEGMECMFICRAHDGNLIDYIAQQGFSTKTLPMGTTTDDTSYSDWLGATWQSDARQTREALNGANPDWLIVDHYALDDRWEQAMRPHCNQLMVIDDLADRPHDCDLLLDQNLGRTKTDYDGLLNTGCKRLIGPHFALLRPEFARLRQESLERRHEPRLKELLITMGGVDQHNATGEVLEALKGCNLPDDLHITVVMGPHAPWLASVQHQATTMAWPTDVRTNVKDMAQLMTNSDLAIGAAGSTSWERCCLGLPSLILVLADNQTKIANSLHEYGAAILVRFISDISEVFPQEATMAQISQSASKLVDGDGVRKVLLELEEMI
ncbi:MAG: UDP-2,4-diacetamido-2,4,6-trideoxy-beta-L-altropyranose hydrolase [Rhodobacteraceae bacterium]|nr:MAG: UDP-2,4-diacetamido-2,4,6-trideoxy-beta-L-altropyranose hydrolase [Paracoccaceae bacterium]